MENTDVNGQKMTCSQRNPSHNTKQLPPDVQKILWEQPPSTTQNHAPGKLSLCVGMPVMLKHNEATEYCITKGAEATVVNWQTITGPKGQNMVDILF
jgi:hypothetical protein